MHSLDIRTMVLGPISTNVYICTSAGGCFIVDPGSSAPAIVEALGGITPTAILLTHGHFDHIMAVNDLKKQYPGIAVYAGAADAEIMLHPGRGIVYREFARNAVSGFIPVEDGDELVIAGVKIRVIATPGHTKGGVCYYLPGEQVLFSGDTLFKASYGRTDFETGDFEELKDSITNRLFARLKDAGHVDVLPGHMEPTTLEEEMAGNPILG